MSVNSLDGNAVVLSGGGAANVLPVYARCVHAISITVFAYVSLHAASFSLPHRTSRMANYTLRGHVRRDYPPATGHGHGSACPHLFGVTHLQNFLARMIVLFSERAPSA